MPQPAEFLWKLQRRIQGTRTRWRIQGRIQGQQPRRKQPWELEGRNECEEYQEEEDHQGSIADWILSMMKDASPEDIAQAAIALRSSMSQGV
jgi:hypothetical protein